MANQNPGSVWSGTDAAVRGQQKRDFDKNLNLVPKNLIKIDIHFKTLLVDVTSCIDSESVNINMLALLNIEITFKNWF